MTSFRRTCLSGFCMSAVLLAIGTAGAATFTNGSFESASVDPADFFIGRVAGDTSITGWRVDRDDIDYIGGYWQASNGVRSIDMDGVQPGSISQTFDTVTGARYEVGFDMAGNPDGPPPSSACRCRPAMTPRSLSSMSRAITGRAWVTSTTCSSSPQSALHPP